MNQEQITLYTDLMTLDAETEAFFFNDHVLDDTTYRIFNYRIASYTDFCRPNALECRGIMFEMDGENAVRLACRPQVKFFNLGENPFTMNLDLSADNIKSVMMKEDGSLISSFMHNGEVRFKSKGSLSSDQADWANMWFTKQSNELREAISILTRTNHTLNFEYCAPYNRIVLNYPAESMILLNGRCNETGETIHVDQMGTTLRSIAVKSADEYSENFRYYSDKELVEKYSGFQDIEGFIVELQDGLFFKLKTDWYLVQHRAKDSVDSPRRLFEAVINEASDDLKTLFHDNSYVLNTIVEMEERAAKIYNHLVERVETFVDDHIDLINRNERKEYALAGQKEFQGSEKMYFGLAMQWYIAKRGDGDEPDYKQFCLKHYKTWGIQDAPPTSPEV